jgi:hypothetical protein
MPPFDRLVTDPAFFRRCLVVHVNLSLVVWFLAFAAALLLALPAGRLGQLAAHTAKLATVGVALMLGAAWLPGTQPVLSNYVPMIDHGLFAFGQSAFAAAVVAVALSRRLVPAGPDASWLAAPAAVFAGLRAVALALLVAGLTFVSSWLGHQDGLGAEAHYELLFWGTGHVLQLVSVAAMLCVWLFLAGSVAGRAPCSRRAASWCFLVLVLPWLAAPLLPVDGTWTSTYREGFTRLMQFGLFPAMIAVGWLSCRTLRGAGVPVRDPRVGGLVASLVLSVAGVLLGAAIRGSTTVVPGHYHASIGAVTVAFMAAAYALLPSLSMALPNGRLGRLAGWQPLVYGAGQLVFALGFALAGAHGMARKTYGHEQALRGVAETTGLVVMGLGGLVAVVGGVLFLWVMTAAWLGRASERPAPVPSSRHPWPIPTANIRSRS